ncbi:Piwi multi-domain protein [Pyrenophora tritici-repentis]|nr:Piwi multi-domain protein [Pyrenophora tritici-repentis]
MRRRTVTASVIRFKRSRRHRPSPLTQIEGQESAMAGPPKPRMQAEKQPNSSSDGSSSASRNPQRSMTKSIPRLDGNRDPSTKIAIDYTQPNDLKNLSEFLGMAGWYAARGVSTNPHISARMYIMRPTAHANTPSCPHPADHANT